MKFLLTPVFLSLALTSAFSIAQTSTSTSNERVSNSALNGEMLYEILVGELNILHGQPLVGFSLLLDAARKSNDAQLFARAVEIALKERSGDAALMAARSWTQALPKDRLANLNLLQILIALNKTSETLEPLKKEIALSSVGERNDAIRLVPRYYARTTDLVAAAAVVQKALDSYTANAETASAAWSAIGRMQMMGANLSGALQSVQKSMAGKNKNDPSAPFLALELLGRGVKDAEILVKQTLAKQESPDFPMAYVRVLIETKRYPEATELALSITQNFPTHAEAWLILGSLQFEQGSEVQAEASLQTYIGLANKTPSENNQRGIIQAQSRRATILAKQGKLKEARLLISQIPAANAEVKRSRLMAELQLLREQRQWQAAFDLLAQHADSDLDLLYEQAMMAEKLDRLDVMEKLLRAIISKDPAHSNAFNALGFSLADRNIRLQEARDLIVKALTLAPGDPFITDSLGWVEYRLGNTTQALVLLEKAFKDRADAEIAAHLGEVLWQLKRESDAISIWRRGLEIAPDNETLQQTLQRFKPGI
ncbi:MAG: tetratricopeptide repeat protein [Burkholderiales bacterium]|nr:tetratricopeptide repeat protein [Burkholderiales bacterium]